MFENLEEKLLQRLVDAENRGRSLTFAQLGAETRGSTFEDLWANMRISVKGKERVIVCEAGPSTEIVATANGKWWLDARKARREGRDPPPHPKDQTVTMF